MNYNQYLDDYWPEEKQEEKQNDTPYEQYSIYYGGQVTCIDRQIAELEARRDAMIHGYCFTGYRPPIVKTYLDPYNLDNEELLKK